MNSTKAFALIFNSVRKDENYVPRSYQTVGGIWAVDTWRKGPVTVQLEDEGYTEVVKHFVDEKMVLCVRSTVRGFTYSTGNEDMLLDLAMNATELFG